MTHEGDIRFEAALAECCDRVRRGESREAVIAAQPATYRNELAHLVPMAVRVGELGLEPSPVFRDRLLRALQAAPPAEAVPWWSGLGSAGRWLTARPAVQIVAVVLVVLLALGGADAVAASDDTLPDSPLYQVKTTREWVEVSLARDANARAKVHLRQMALRELELEKAVQTSRPPVVVGTVAGRLADATVRVVDSSLDARGQGVPARAKEAAGALRLLNRRLEAMSARSAPRRQAALAHVVQVVQDQMARLGPD